jgi:hypothetical protein
LRQIFSRAKRLEMKMTDTAREIRRLAGQGFCCSQIMVKMGLDAKGDENPELVDAVAGLCGGLHSGLCCGILTGAACLLSLYDRKNAASIMIPRLVKWFQTSYEQAYGGITCGEILDGNLTNRMDRCPKIMEETFERCRELLAEFDLEI